MGHTGFGAHRKAETGKTNDLRKRREAYNASRRFLLPLPDQGKRMWTQTVFRCREWYLGCRYGRIDPTATAGERGEQAAARMLRQQGLVIIAKNEADRGGEVDLIAVDRGSRTVVFIEVKTHSSIKPGHPAERVDQKKQGRVTRAAMRYLRRKQLLGVAARFDVVAVWWPSGQSTPKRIEHYQSAFDAVGPHQFYS